MTFTGFDTVVFTDTEGVGRGGNMTVRSADLELTNLSILGTQTRGMGKGGDVRIDTNNLRLGDGAQVAVYTTDSGLGGNLTVKASDSIAIVGESNLLNPPLPSLLFTDTTGSGKAGDIRIETGNLSVRDGARISASTFSDGDAGNIAIQARKVELTGNQTASQASGVFSQVEPEASGQVAALRSIPKHYVLIAVLKCQLVLFLLVKLAVFLLLLKASKFKEKQQILNLVVCLLKWKLGQPVKAVTYL